MRFLITFEKLHFRSDSNSGDTILNYGLHVEKNGSDPAMSRLPVWQLQSSKDGLSGQTGPNEHSAVAYSACKFAYYNILYSNLWEMAI